MMRFGHRDRKQGERNFLSFGTRLQAQSGTKRLRDRLDWNLCFTKLNKKQGSASVIAMLNPVFLFELLVAQTMTAD